MIPFLYPAEPDKTPAWLLRFNALVTTGALTGTGVLSLAFDVWRNGNHLFRSYDLDSQSESLDDWCRRNYPTLESPDFRNSPMGLTYGVPGIDNWPVPTRAACDNRVTYERAIMILEAALAVSQLPFAPSRVGSMPTANSIRQRMFAIGRERDWIRIQINDAENDIAIRAVLARGIGEEPGRPMANYLVTLEPRKSTLTRGNLEPHSVQVESYDADMRHEANRRPILKAAKKALGLTGANSACRMSEEVQARYALTAYPFSIMIQRIGAVENDAAPLTGGLDLCR